MEISLTDEECEDVLDFFKYCKGHASIISFYSEWGEKVFCFNDGSGGTVNIIRKPNDNEE